MGGNIPLPALLAKTPEQPDPLQGLQRILAIKSLLGQQKMQDVETQQKQTQLQDSQAQTAAMREWDGKDLNDLPGLILKHGGSATAVFGTKNSIVDYQTKLAKATADQLANEKTKNDYFAQAIDNVKSLPIDQQPAAFEDAKADAVKRGHLDPQQAQTLTYQGPEQLDMLEKSLIGDSAAVEQAAKTATAQGALQRGQAAAGELTLKQNEFAAKTDPNSPLYDPSAAFLAKKAAAGDPEAQSILAQQTKQAGAKAGAEAAAKFPYELQLKQQELAQNPVFAVNPKTGQRELTTMGDVKANGFTNPVKVSQPDIEKETTLNAQMNELQLNTSRYKTALNAMGPLSKSDVANMTRVLSDKSISGYLTNELTLGAVMDQISQGEKASAWNALSPDKQAALMGSLRMKNSALLFQKVATGMGRASKEAMDIEISNMPSPIEGATVGNQKLQAFQENVDQMAARSVKLPWMEQPSDVKARIEGQATNDYNQRQAAKPQGQYRAKGTVTVGQNIQLPNTAGLSRVKKVYSDGTFDADQKP